MQFKKISINGISYGETEDENDPKYLKDISEFPKVTNVNFREKTLIDILRNPNHPENKNITNTLVFLAITHTIIISEDQDPENPTKTIK